MSIKEKEPEKVKIEKDKLDALMKRIERLESSADKARLAHFDERAKREGEKFIKLSMINGKVVMRWDPMPKNLVEKHPLTGVWYEDQIIKLTYEDGKQEEMPYVVFSRRYQHLSARVLSETKILDPAIIEADGEISFRVQTVDNKTYQIGSKFIN